MLLVRVVMVALEPEDDIYTEDDVYMLLYRVVTVTFKTTAARYCPGL